MATVAVNVSMGGMARPKYVQVVLRYWLIDFFAWIYFWKSES